MDLRLGTIRDRLRLHEPRVLPRAGGTRAAAVAAILRERAGRSVEALFIRRAESPQDPWSGHMAFPGGRQDPGDRDLVATAQRETLEEVGIDLAARAERLGHLDEIEAVAKGKPTGLVIRPYVFELIGEDDPPLYPNYEVDEALWLPLRPMAEGELDTFYRYTRHGLDLTLPAYDADGRIVWGLTYQMLQVLFALLGADASRTPDA